MRKFIALAALVILLIPNFTNAQNSAATNSALRTGVWEGKATYINSAIKLNVESVTGRHVKAQLNFIDSGNAIVELSGEIVDSFGDFAEQSKWQFVTKDKKFKDGTWVKLTEVKLIQGSWDIKQTYYIFVTGDSMVGCFYYATEPAPRGRIELHAPEQ